MQAGEIIQGYRLVSHLGDGGMASVWRAERMDGLPVAIKVLDEKLARRAQFRQRFFAEGELQSKLRHPHVVRVEQILLDPLALVMELVEGGTLARELRRGRPSWPRVRTLMAGITAGVGAAHAMKILHRDLKPQNVLLTLEGLPKVADFGLAKIAGMEGATRTGQVMGTLKYMAPEQFHGRKDIDLRADVYALGVILYQMLAGRVPFSGSDFELGRAHVETPPPDPREFASDVPEILVELLERALAKDPEARPADAHEFGLLVEEAFYTLERSASLIEAPPELATVEQALVLPEEPEPAPEAPAVEPSRREPPSITDVPPLARPGTRTRWLWLIGGIGGLSGVLLMANNVLRGPAVLEAARSLAPDGAPPDAAPETVVVAAPLDAAPPGAAPTLPAPAALKAAAPSVPVKAPPSQTSGGPDVPAPGPAYQEVMAGALALINEERYAEAVAPLLRAAALDPPALLPHKSLCAVLPGLERIDEALTHCRLWQAREPDAGERQRAALRVEQLEGKPLKYSP